MSKIKEERNLDARNYLKKHSGLFLCGRSLGWQTSKYGCTRKFTKDLERPYSEKLVGACISSKTLQVKVCSNQLKTNVLFKYIVSEG